MKNNHVTLVFDLDETVINSNHRTPNKADGTLDLQAYFASHNEKNVNKDTLLPLAATLQRVIKEGYQVAILTARTMKWFDYAFLRRHGIDPAWIFSRDHYYCTDKHSALGDGAYKVEWFRIMPNHLKTRHVIMFDDAKPVKSALRKAGIVCLCAHKVNKKLYTLAKNGNTN